RMADANPEDLHSRISLAGAHHDVGEVLWFVGRRPEADAQFGAEMELARKLAADHPDKPVFRVLLATRHLAHVERLLGSGELAAAEAACREALSISQNVDAEPSVTRDHPVRPELERDLAESHRMLGVIAVRAGRSAEAEAAFRTAIVNYRT